MSILVTGGRYQHPEHSTAATDISANCIVPLITGVCGEPVPLDLPLPLCFSHVASAWDYCQGKILQARNEPQEPSDLDEFERKLKAAAEAKAAELAALEADTFVDDPDSVVYYLRFGDRIKIGRSRNLTERLKALPHDELLALEPGGAKVENRRHRQFKEHRLVGEWFAASEPVLAHIQQVRDAETQRLVSVRLAREAFKHIPEPRYPGEYDPAELMDQLRQKA